MKVAFWCDDTSRVWLGEAQMELTLVWAVS